MCRTQWSSDARESEEHPMGGYRNLSWGLFHLRGKTVGFQRWADPAERWGLTRSAMEKTKDTIPGTTYRETKGSVRVFWAVWDGLTRQKSQHGG
jgi:hypothetical protein